MEERQGEGRHVWTVMPNEYDVEVTSVHSTKEGAIEFVKELMRMHATNILSWEVVEPARFTEGRYCTLLRMHTTNPLVPLEWVIERKILDPVVA